MLRKFTSSKGKDEPASTVGKKKESGPTVTSIAATGTGAG